MTTKNKPYRMWQMDMAFTKDGFPSAGTAGASIRRVVVLETETFQRLVREHPELQTTAEYELCRM